MDIEEAKVAARECLTRKSQSSVRLELREMPGLGVYGFDLEGRAIFLVTETDSWRVGGDEYVAVNITTGEAKSLGVWKLERKSHLTSTSRRP